MGDATAVTAFLPLSFQCGDRDRDRRRIPSYCRAAHSWLPNRRHQQKNAGVFGDSCRHARCLPCPTVGKLSPRLCSSPIQFIEKHSRNGDMHSGDPPVLAHPLREETGSVGEACQVFDVLEKRELLQATGSDYYSRVIRRLCEEGSAPEANRVVRRMAEVDLKPSLSVYHRVVHALAREGDFPGAWDAIRCMTEIGLAPVPETYHGLIRAYGSARMYDGISKCMKMMVSMGCSPNEVTYNILIVEYARGGLLERLEGAHRSIRSKRMRLLPSTLVVMLETYADLGVLDKMERAYRNALSSNVHLKESLIRKLAVVYIKHFRFMRLEELGNEIASRNGRVFLVWCLLLLCSALSASRRGVESITREMKLANVSPCITFTNIIASAYAKMKNYRDLEPLLSQIGSSGVRPDLVTVGILFDACADGFDGARVLDAWRRHMFLEQRVEIDTDTLVVAAFGKGTFRLRCEERFEAREPENRIKKAWTYIDLIRLVFD